MKLAIAVRQSILPLARRFDYIEEVAMLNISENAFRDYIFNNHREDFSSLIAGRREPVEWYGEEFTPLNFLLSRKVERAIN